MDRNRTTDTKALRQIVAVLLALADLAERASGRSLAVRTLVLWLLRSGEVLARNHLAGLTPEAAGLSEPVPLTDDSATEAMRLATSFRQLAAALTILAAKSLASRQQAIAVRFSALFATHPQAASRIRTTTVGRRDSS